MTTGFFFVPLTESADRDLHKILQEAFREAALFFASDVMAKVKILVLSGSDSGQNSTGSK
jgi:hypothetical protein